MHETVFVDAGRLQLEIAGSGPTVVLLHGGPGTYDYLSDSAIASWLAGSKRVVGYDQRGCRGSSSPGPFTVQANVEDLEAIRRHQLVDRMTIIGHSWGGLLGLFYAADYPARVERLVLVGSAGPRGGWERPFQDEINRRHTAEQRRELADIDARIARTRDRAQRSELYRRHFNAALASYVAPAHRGKEPELEALNRQVNAALMVDLHKRMHFHQGWEQGLADLAAPVVVMHGRQDPMPWKVVQDIREMLPHATVIPLEDCGHFPWLERPELFREALLDALELS